MRPKLDLTGVNHEAVRAEQERDYRRPVEGWTLPSILPPLWERLEHDHVGAYYENHVQQLHVILSCSYEQDGRPWIHMSLSHRTREPKWRELVECKEIFLGDREAYKILPPKARYININPHVHHLFALFEPGAVALPDFTRGTGSL